jgi:hypothetical protein
MKLDKKVVQRRVDLMAAEGITFVTNAHVGVNTDAAQIKADHDAVIVSTGELRRYSLCDSDDHIGATWPRDLKLPNRETDGIHFAMDFLHPNTKSLLDTEHEDARFLSARGKDVIVIGGGDTGNDCIGTSVRHGAKSVVNFELLPGEYISCGPCAILTLDQNLLLVVLLRTHGRNLRESRRLITDIRKLWRTSVGRIPESTAFPPRGSSWTTRASSRVLIPSG